MPDQAIERIGADLIGPSPERQLARAWNSEGDGGLTHPSGSALRAHPTASRTQTQSPPVVLTMDEPNQFAFRFFRARPATLRIRGFDDDDEGTF